MREYEIMVIYDLALAESQGNDASAQHLTSLVEGHGGAVRIMDHWGRRRMAYKINNQLDGDYVLARVDLEPGAVNPIQADLRINEQVFRWLVVRADELPPYTPRDVVQEEQQVPAPAATAAPGVAAEATAETPAAPASETAADAGPAAATGDPAPSDVSPPADEPAAAADADEPAPAIESAGADESAPEEPASEAAAPAEEAPAGAEPNAEDETERVAAQSGTNEE